MEGGVALAYRPDSLLPEKWQSANRLPPLDLVLGFDADQRLVYVLDTRRRLIGLDLESGMSRPYLSGVERAAIGPDGAAYVVDSANRLLRLARRATTVFPARLPAAQTTLFGAIGGQVTALRDGAPPQAQLLSVERAGPAMALGSGPAASSYWGELLASADGDQVRLYRVSDGTLQRQLDLSGPAIALLFSPSGHRLYALEADRITVADRFSGDRLGAVDLPGPASALRGDASGRWLLARSATGDSILVVDLATMRFLGAIPGEWQADLPLVAGATTVLVRGAGDVASYDLSVTPPAQRAWIPGGGVDRWIAVPWVPPLREGIAMAAAESARAVQDRGLLPTDPLEVEGTIWLQVSSSQNPEWANDLARQLADAGFPSAIWPPQSSEDGHRVMVGPYRTREQAEEAGRRLGRPNFVVTLDPGEGPP